MITVLGYYLQEVLTNSPKVLWRKLHRKLSLKVKRKFGQIHTQLIHKNISDEMFLESLTPTFTTFNDYWEFNTNRESPNFFLDNFQQQIEIIDNYFPETRQATKQIADQIIEHKFDLLGSGLKCLDHPIDWHCDFRTDYHFNPKEYYANIFPAAFPGGFDIKVPWELSRFQHVLWLGQAYLHTNDEKYTHEFVSQITDWIEKNPSRLGVNWACTMDVAIRAVNWLWGYNFFKNSPVLGDDFLLVFFKSLLVHGRHIINNLEWSEELTNNHYLSNLVGLVYLGILMPDFSEAARWRKFGLLELEKEMFKQVYEDGVNFEASTAYHRLETELFLSVTLLANLNGYTFSLNFMNRLEKMLDFMMYATKPDGLIPLVGDNDNGRLHRLKVYPDPLQEWRDYRYLLAIGAVLFRRVKFAQAAGDQWEESIWFFGEEALMYKQDIEEKQLPPLQLKSRSFSDAGWYIMRDKDMYMFISAGQNGQNGFGGHAHNDKLSFELFANGQTWIIDPGTYTYTSDYDLRNELRSTKYHNTVVVDGKEQNFSPIMQRNIFLLPDITQVKVTHWSNCDEYDLFIGNHFGYARLLPSIVHKRIIFFDKFASIWIFYDCISQPIDQPVSTCLHIAPDVQIKSLTKSGLELGISEIEDQILSITLCQNDPVMPVIKESMVSLGYGSQQPSSILEWIWDNKCQEFGYVITMNRLGTENTKQISKAYDRYSRVLKNVVKENPKI